jgi:hypothetical protein
LYGYDVELVLEFGFKLIIWQCVNVVYKLKSSCMIQLFKFQNMDIKSFEVSKPKKWMEMNKFGYMMWLWCVLYVLFQW